MWRARRRCRLATPPSSPGRAGAAAAAQVDEDRGRLARLHARRAQHVVHVGCVCRWARRQCRTKTGRSTRSARAVGEDSLGKGLERSTVSARRHRRAPAPRAARPWAACRPPSRRPSPCRTSAPSRVVGRQRRCSAAVCGFEGEFASAARSVDARGGEGRARARGDGCRGRARRGARRRARRARAEQLHMCVGTGAHAHAA